MGVPQIVLSKLNSLRNLNRSKQLFKQEKDGVKAILNLLDSEGLYPEFRTITDGVNEPEVTVDGKKYLMFCSNNYLGLSEHPEVKKAAVEAINKFGVGPGGSRVVSGNVDVIERLESNLALLTGSQDCLTFPTGYMANVAVFQALMDPFIKDFPFDIEDSVIFSDECNHGSIIDGIRLSRAKKVIFKHDDLDDLITKIRQNNLNNKLIVTESVFSTEGEIIDIPSYIQVAEETGSKLMVDDAHGIGILGKRGGGVAERFNCQGKIDILMGSMDKALGGTGGFLCGNKETIRFLRVASRSSILSSATPIATAGSIDRAIKLLSSKLFCNARKQLFERSSRVRKELSQVGFRILGKDNLPAIPLFLGDESLALRFSRELWSLGLFVMVFRWPAVPFGKSRLRITLMSSHRDSHIEKLIGSCIRVGRQIGLI